MLSSVDSLLLQSRITISELNKTSCEALRSSSAPHAQDTGALSCCNVLSEFQRPYKDGILLDFLLAEENWSREVRLGREIQSERSNQLLSQAPVLA